MTGTTPQFDIRDDKTFDDNFQAFSNELTALDSALGPVLKNLLPDLVSGRITKADVWDELLAAAARDNAP